MTHRRQFSAEFKAQVGLELLSGAKSRAELCREHQLAASVLAEWKAISLRHAPTAFESPEHHSRPDAAQVAELERLVGRLTLENDILKNLLRLAARRRATCEWRNVLQSGMVPQWEERPFADWGCVPPR